MVTGKEDDAKAALAAETGLKDAIDQSMKGTTNPARLEQITRLAREFRIFTRIFAEILRVKQESALIAQNQLARGANRLRYKLDDLPSNADEAELPAIEFGAKKVTAQYQAVTALANTFVINADQTVAASAHGADQVRRERAARELVEGGKRSPSRLKEAPRCSRNTSRRWPS